MSTGLPGAVTLFYCYAHEDTWLLDALDRHLAPLKRQGYFSGWHDRQIAAGAHWQDEIERSLSDANLILLLLSPDFVHSDACEAQMHRAIALRRAGRAQVIPILLRPVLWEQTPVAGFAGLPENGEPITTWANQDHALRLIAIHLAHIVRKQLNLPPLPIQDWQALVSALPQASSPSPGDDPSFVPRNPYRGLQAFMEEHAADFFGRERLIEDLLHALEQKILPSHEGSARLLTVVGPSGCGKSSVVMAGLLPALKGGRIPGSDAWIYLEPIVPGPHPLEALARTLSSHFPQRSLTSLLEDLAAPNARGLSLLLEALLKNKPTTLFLYIDQFEEIFTQPLENDERMQFINLLLTAVREPDGPLILILSLRADFYDRPMLQAPHLFRLMHTAQIAVLPLDQRDVRDIMKKPAAQPDVNLRFEDDLVGELLAEMRGQSGALPLLQFTLDRLFQARQGHLLTLEAYHAMGGVQGALAQYAEAVYTSLPTEEHRSEARALFLCLVEPGASGQNPTRRRVALSELAIDTTRRALLLEVAARFTTARLLTTTGQERTIMIEMSHEAIIRGWTRLAEWMHHAHADLYLQRRVREDAAAWLAQGCPTVRLYQGEQLDEALRWQDRSLMSRDESLFLSAGVQQRTVATQKAALLRQHYRRRAVVASMGGLALAAVATTIGIQLFNPSASMTLPYTYTGHTDGVNGVAWLPDSTRLASAGNDGTVRIWSASNGLTLLTCTGHTDSVSSVAWSPDSTRLASASADTTIRIWDATSGLTLLTCTGHTDRVGSVAWSPDGTHLASASADTTIRIWDATSGLTLLTCTGHPGGVNGVAWSPDSTRLASAGADKTVRIWGAQSGHIVRICTGHTAGVRSVAWSPDGTRLASASDDETVRIRDATSGLILLTCPGHINAVNSVAWSPDGTRLASAGDDETVRIWDARLFDGRTVLSPKGHTDGVNSVAWSPGGTHLALAGTDTMVRIWDAASGLTLLTCIGHTDVVNSVAWSPDGTRLASAGWDKIVRIWDATSGLTVLTCPGHTDSVRSVAWSPDGTRLASAGWDKIVRIWDATSGLILHTCPGHTDGVNSVAWSLDGTRLASAGWDKTVRIWDTASGLILLTCIGHTDGVSSVAWFPNSTRFASASVDKTVRIWDATSGQTLHACTGHTNRVSSVVWFPNDTRLASAGWDKTVRIWDTISGQTLLTYMGHTDRVNSVAWSPDGTRLASAGDDGVQIFLWVSGS